jgi:hypothetical protein
LTPVSFENQVGPVCTIPHSQNAVCNFCCQGQVIFDGLEETRTYSLWEFHCLDVVFGQHCINAIEGGADKRNAMRVGLCLHFA